MQCNRANWRQPPRFAAEMADLISPCVPIPQEMIKGSPVAAALPIKGVLTSSKLAILSAGTPNETRKSTVSRSKTDEKQVMGRLFAKFIMSFAILGGVSAFL